MDEEIIYQVFCEREKDIGENEVEYFECYSNERCAAYACLNLNWKTQGVRWHYVPVDLHKEQYNKKYSMKAKWEASYNKDGEVVELRRKGFLCEEKEPDFEVVSQSKNGEYVINFYRSEDSEEDLLTAAQRVWFQAKDQKKIKLEVKS